MFEPSLRKRPSTHHKMKFKDKKLNQTQWFTVQNTFTTTGRRPSSVDNGNPNRYSIYCNHLVFLNTI